MTAEIDLELTVADYDGASQMLWFGAKTQLAADFNKPVIVEDEAAIILYMHGSDDSQF